MSNRSVIDFGSWLDDVLDEVQARAAGTAGVHEQAADPLLRAGGRRPGHREVDVAPRRVGVVERHGERRALTLVAGVPLERRGREPGRPTVAVVGGARRGAGVPAACGLGSDDEQPAVATTCRDHEHDAETAS